MVKDDKKLWIINIQEALKMVRNKAMVKLYIKLKAVRSHMQHFVKE